MIQEQGISHIPSNFFSDRSVTNVGFNAIFFSLLVLLFGLGLFAIFSGCKGYLFLQKLKITPTSKAGSVAIGLVELAGQAVCREPVTSPISGVRCVYWRITGEYYKEGKHGGWKTLHEAGNLDQFYVGDDTGRMLVDPRGGEIDIAPDATFEGYIREHGFLFTGSATMDERVIRYIGGLDADSRSPFDSHSSEKFRFTEYFIRENDPLYVLGTALPTDGASGVTNEGTLIIRKGTYDNTLYITDTTEKNVADRHFYKVYPKIILGFACSSLCLSVIMMMLETTTEKVFFLGMTMFVLIVAYFWQRGN
jgi:hypothetical protein